MWFIFLACSNAYSYKSHAANLRQNCRECQNKAHFPQWHLSMLSYCQKLLNQLVQLLCKILICRKLYYAFSSMYVADWFQWMHSNTASRYRISASTSSVLMLDPGPTIDIWVKAYKAQRRSNFSMECNSQRVKLEQTTQQQTEAELVEDQDKL